MSMVTGNWPPRHWSLALKGGVLVGACLLMLLGSSLTSYLLERKTAVATRDMLRTIEVQADILRLHMQIAEAATGVRGFLLTGRDDFLTPYRAASTQLPLTLASLQAKVRDPEQWVRLRRVLPLVQNKLDSLELMRRQGVSSPVQLQQHLLSSKQILDQLRSEIGAMSQRETLLVAQGTLALQQASNRNLWMTMIVNGASVAGALATLWFTLGLVRRVRLAAENAERLTNDLPLKPMPATHDELGQLAERLHQASVLLAGRASTALAASQAKTEFLARTSHELRSPMHAILGYAQLLERGCSTPREREQAAQISQAGRHLLALINQVLEIGSIEAGQLVFANGPVPLLPLLEQALAMMSPLARARAVHLRMGAEPSCVVAADRQRLLQVLLNVLSNAIHYSPTGSVVQLSHAVDGGTVMIHVDDRGPGIALPLQHRLFTPFDRLGRAPDQAQGAGLGLAVSRALMQAMHGEIGHLNLAHGGSRFTLRLPWSTLTAHAARAAPDPLGMAGNQAPNQVPNQAPNQARLPDSAPPEPVRYAICIDDDRAMQTLLAALTQRRSQWQIEVSADVLAGLALARKRRPDLLFLSNRLAEPLALAALDEVCPAALVLLGAAPPGAAVPRRHLSTPLEVPQFFALLDQVESLS